MEVANALVCSLAHPAGESVQDKGLIKNRSQGSIKHLMDQAISDASFAEKALLRIKRLKMRINIVLIVVSDQIFV